MSGVRAVAVSRVVPALPDPAPVVKLSFLDAPWVATPPVQVLFLYHQLLATGEYPAVVARLKASLATTLARFVPLVGKLAYVPDTGDVVVDCCDAGVPFVEAEAEGMDARRLAGDEAHDVAAFVGLVTEHDARVLPAPVMCVQATRLGAAGLALGVSVHHAVVDGRAMGLFLAAWAAACRGGAPVPLSPPPPDYGREALGGGGGELARQLLNKVAPNLPVANAKADYFSQRCRMARRTFFLGADEIRPLFRPAVSTFVALLALGWTAIVRAKADNRSGSCYLSFYADLRGRLRPAVGDAYFGNCVRGCLATAGAGELLGEAGHQHAARAVQAAVAELEAAPLAGTEGGWLERLAGLPPARLTRVAGDPLLRSYDMADFGFGRPARVEPVSMSHDGRIMLRGGRRAGEVQLTVSLHPMHMDAFKAQILSNIIAFNSSSKIRPRI